MQFGSSDWVADFRQNFSNLPGTGDGWARKDLGECADTRMTSTSFLHHPKVSYCSLCITASKLDKHLNQGQDVAGVKVINRAAPRSTSSRI